MTLKNLLKINKLLFQWVIDVRDTSHIAETSMTESSNFTITLLDPRNPRNIRTLTPTTIASQTPNILETDEFNSMSQTSDMVDRKH